MDDSTTDDTTDDTRATVTRLLKTANLVVADSEFERFVGVYPMLRAQADGLYAPEFAAEDLSLVYDPTIGFS